MKTIKNIILIFSLIILSSFITKENKFTSNLIDKKFSPQIISEFGIKKHPVLNIEKMHNGIDITANPKAKIKCVENGKVLEVINGNYKFGNYVIIEHSNKIRTLYAHLSKIDIRKGDFVKSGQIIGIIGKTGRVTKTQLHFEVFKNEKNVNPLKFLN